MPNFAPLNSKTSQAKKHLQGSLQLKRTNYVPAPTAVMLLAEATVKLMSEERILHLKKVVADSLVVLQQKSEVPHAHAGRCNKQGCEAQACVNSGPTWNRED